MIAYAYSLQQYFLNPVLYQVYQFRFDNLVTDKQNPDKIIKTNTARFINITLIEQNRYKSAYQFFTSKVDITQNIGTVVDKFFKIEFLDALDELILIVSNEGKIIKVHNIIEVAAEWAVTSAELKIVHKGTEIDYFFDKITSLLNNESALIAYLSDYSMFGLYFHGLFGNNKLYNLPIVRQQQLNDFTGKTITEQVNPERRNLVKYSIEGITSTERRPIENGFDIYYGELIYTDEQLQEAFLETESDTINIKYNIQFLG